MARPRKQGLDYFPHDTDAVGDEKIEAIRALYGNDGYAFYFILLERIYRSESASLDISRFALRTALISKIGITSELFDCMLETSFEIGLFDRDTYSQHQSITSPGIQKRFSKVDMYREGWRKNKSDSNKSAEDDAKEDVFHVENHSSDALSTEKSTQSKEKKSKEKESKTAYAEFVYMFPDQYAKLAEKYGPELTAEMITTLDNYKGSSGKRYKDDYRAILSWVADKVLDKRKAGMQGRNDYTFQLLKEAEERERNGFDQAIRNHPEHV